MSKITPLVAGNWKMNGLREQAVELGKLAEGMEKDIYLRRQATLLDAAKRDMDQ